MTDVGNRGIFTEEHDIFRNQVRRFVEEELKPHHARWEEQGHVDREAWLKAGAQGLHGVNIKEEHHGLGADILSAAIVWEELAYGFCSGPGFQLHSDIVMPYISAYGSQHQIDHFLPRMTRGECIGAIGMTEPGAGSDLQGIRTAAKRDGDDWILNGSKIFITNGHHCDVCVVVAVTDPAAKSAAHGISLFLVEGGLPGFNKGRKLKKMGLAAQDTSELFFEDVRLNTKTHLLGEVNRGFYYLMQELPRERLLVGDISQAMGEAMFECTRDYLAERKAFGKSLNRLQTIQHRLAALKTELCVSRAFTDQCLALLDEGRLDSATASMAKYWASDLANKVAAECVQLHGGYGFMMEYPVCKGYLDARVQTIYAGSNEIMKELIARTIIN